MKDKIIWRLEQLIKWIESLKEKLETYNEAIKTLNNELTDDDKQQLKELKEEADNCLDNNDFTGLEKVLRKISILIQRIKKRNHTRNGIQKKTDVKKSQSKKRT